MRADDDRHGSEAGYEQHVRDGDGKRSCPACYEAKLVSSRRRSKRKAMGYRYTVPSDRARVRVQTWRDGGATWGDISDHTGIESGRLWEIHHDGAPAIYARTAYAILSAGDWPVTALGIRRRVQALTRLGWTTPNVAAACNVHHDTIIDIRRRQPEFIARKVRDGIVAGYLALCDTLPQPTTQQERAGVTRARNYAERNGWAPPIAWDDIDDPNEQPGTIKRSVGRPPRKEDALQDFEWLTSQGVSDEHAAARVGVKLATIRDYQRQVVAA